MRCCSDMDIEARHGKTERAANCASSKCGSIATAVSSTETKKDLTSLAGLSQFSEAFGSSAWIACDPIASTATASIAVDLASPSPTSSSKAASQALEAQCRRCGCDIRRLGRLRNAPRSTSAGADVAIRGATALLVARSCVATFEPLRRGGCTGPRLEPRVRLRFLIDGTCNGHCRRLFAAFATAASSRQARKVGEDWDLFFTASSSAGGAECGR